MFAVLYRFRLKPGTEARFAQAWEAVTHALRDQHGGEGSCLHRGDDGLWVAYARWPSREAWAAEHPLDDPSHLEAMAACVEERLAPIPLEVARDLLVGRARGGG